jgi:hypothetical protein
MDPINQLHSEFYDDHAYPFDEPHTIPEGWDAEALLRSVTTGSQGAAVEGSLPQPPLTLESANDAKNPVS